MRKWLIGLTLLCSGFVMTIMVVEFALSKFPPHYRTLHREVLKDRLIRAKSVIGGKSELSYDEFVKINSHGFRDKERSHEKERGVFRIVVLGDSMTEGLQVPLEQSYPRILETMLNSDNGNKFEVINLGVSGFNTAQEYLTFKYYGSSYEPDFVILAFFIGDDVRNNASALENGLVDGNGGEIGNEHKPDAGLNDERVVEKALKIWGNGFGKERANRNEDGLFQTIKRSLFPNIYYSLADWVKGTPGLANLFLKPGGPNTKPKKVNIPSPYQVYADKYSPQLLNDWKVTKFLISKLAKELRKSGTEFLVVVIPNEFEFNPDEWGKVMRKYPEIRAVNFDIKKPERMLVSVLEKNNIDYLLLRPKLEEHSGRTDKDLYFGYHGGFHLNSNGHALAAQLIYKKLRKDYKLIPRASYTLKNKSCDKDLYSSLLSSDCPSSKKID